ncbi:MAG: hypothetical protein K2J96_03565, partial [Bacteroidaceae bacterium]|nr:hypothetical protein [Bacteroidaceae bacterium]
MKIIQIITMKKSLWASLLGAVICVSCGQAGQKVYGPVYLDENSPLEARVEDALSRMTLEEKVKVLHGQAKFSSAGVPRLGIPELG